MRDLLASVALAGIVVGCASLPSQSGAYEALDRAELLVVRGDYAGALTAYDEFLRHRPDHARARASRDTVAQVVTARAEVARLREELTTRDRELASAREELARTRQELQARQAEADKLRTDLERLKQIDLKPERKRP